MIAAVQGFDLNNLREYDDRLVRMMVERVRVLGDDKVLVEFGLGVGYECKIVAHM